MPLSLVLVHLKMLRTHSTLHLSDRETNIKKVIRSDLWPNIGILSF